MFAQPVHTDVFISYRRIDVDFVKQFVDALKDDGKEVWVDWEDLPPGGAEFTEDIRRGIEGADSFICVLSPDYMESPYCVDLELGYAVELHKKIIPVVFREFDDVLIPPGISHINWIYFIPHAGQENTFEDSIERVIEAIEVDFGYVRDHTRLLQRAREWEDNDQKSSYLLTGDEVTEAESWLAQSVLKRPIATVTHHRFVQASRQWENQKTRRNLSIAIFVTILSVVLAAFALIQRQNAIEQRGIAEEQRAIAVDERNRAEEQKSLSDSRRLAVQSRVALGDGKVDLSLLLSLEAIESAFTLEAVGSLVTVLEDNPYLETYLYDHPGQLTALAYHPTEPILITGAEDGSLAIWDMTDVPEVVADAPEADYEVWDIDYHPNGEQFAVALSDGSIEIYSGNGEEQLDVIENAHDGIITSLTYSPDGEQFVTTSYDNNVKVWRTDSFEAVILKIDDVETTHTDWILDADYSPDGGQLAVITWDNVLQIWDLNTQTLAFEPLQLSSESANFSLTTTWSPDGRFILMGDVLGNIRFVDASTGMLLDLVLSRHSDHVREIVYSPTGEFFASVSHDSTIYLWNASNGQPIIDEPIIVHSNHVNGVTFSPDGSQMITVGDDGRAVLFDMTRPDLLGELVLTHESEIYEVIYLADGTGIISAGLDGNIYLTDTATNESSVLFDPDIGRITALALSSDESQLALASDAGMMQIWDFATYEPLTDAFSAHGATIFSLALNPDSTLLASAGDSGNILIWEIDRLLAGETAQLETLSDHEDGVFDVAWHPTQAILASASRDDTLRLWNTETWETIEVLEGHSDDVQTIAFHPSGEILVSGSRDKDIIVWYIDSILSGEDVIAELLGSHDDWVLSLAFSPDGEYLVSGGRDDAINLWDNFSLQRIGEPLIHHDSWVWAVDVSPDGLNIVSGGRDGRMVIWNVDADEWELLACQIANRPFSLDEWSQYRPETDYRDICF